MMEKVKSPIHEHNLLSITRFSSGPCEGCRSGPFGVFLYGGYRCNEQGCETVFHRECAETLPEINHSFHPDHPLKLIIQDSRPTCSFCGEKSKICYCCSICDFKLDLQCARRAEPLVLPANSYGHEHPLQLFCEPGVYYICKPCGRYVNGRVPHYICHQCKFAIHVDCVNFFPEAYHTSHPQHPLKSLDSQVPDYADTQCLLCAAEFDPRHHKLHHCDVCNFSICRACMKNPPPIDVECLRTHAHQLHLVPRLIDFTCNACGTHGDRSPYFCLECNFMIHRECIGLPRVININRHDHPISYTARLGGHGDWKCKVCRKKVDGFYGGYTCSKCPSFAVHSLCATSEDVWDMVELEGTSEEEIIAPFEVIDENTIKHFSHDHNLQINKGGQILPESTLCEACVFQICSEPFYSCELCEFILHEKCAHLPQRKRNAYSNQPFILHTDSRPTSCLVCDQFFTGFRYKSGSNIHHTIDVRCASISDSLVHESHQHPLFYTRINQQWPRECSRCGKKNIVFFSCDECEYILDGKCALLPKKVMKKRYDDHPLFLSYGDKNVDGEYWCEACETKVDPKRGFYACNNCGVVLHISCVVGDFSHIKPGSVVSCVVKVDCFAYIKPSSITRPNEMVVSNTSFNRPLCYMCNSRCKLPSILKLHKTGVDVYICSLECRKNLGD